MTERSVNDFFPEESEEKNIEAPADFGQRLAAYIIDVIIIVLFLVFTVPFLWHLIKNYNPDNISGFFIISVILFYLLGPFLLKTLYWTIFESSSLQATPGKAIAGIKVVNKIGKRATFLNCFGRNIGKFVSAIIFYFGFLMILFNRDKKSLHDNMSGTSVIISKQKKGINAKLFLSIGGFLILTMFLPNGFDNIKENDDYRTALLKNDKAAMSIDPHIDGDSLSFLLKFAFDVIDGENDILDNMKFLSKVNDQKLMILVDVPYLSAASEDNKESLLESVGVFLDNREGQKEYERYIGLYSSGMLVAALTPLDTIIKRRVDENVLYKFYGPDISTPIPETIDSL